jgi:hypothetical protein
VDVSQNWQIRHGFVHCDIPESESRKRALSEYYRLLPGNTTLVDLPGYALYLGQLAQERAPGLLDWVRHPGAVCAALVQPLWPCWYRKGGEFPCVRLGRADFSRPALEMVATFGILFVLALPFQSLAYLFGFPGGLFKPKNWLQWGVPSKAHEQLLQFCVGLWVCVICLLILE